jgi:hypothetical protein
VSLKWTVATMLPFDVLITVVSVEPFLMVMA